MVMFSAAVRCKIAITLWISQMTDQRLRSETPFLIFNTEGPVNTT